MSKTLKKVREEPSGALKKMREEDIWGKSISGRGNRRYKGPVFKKFMFASYKPSFARATVTEYYRPEGLHHRNSFLHNAGG